MPRRKPIGWPKLMVARRLKSGATAYYWVPPTWAVKAGCKMRSEALGTDYAEAKRRCDEVLNPHFDAWRLRDETPPADERTVAGTFDWMTAVAKSSPKWPKRPATVKSYDAALRLVSAYVLKDGRKFGALSNPFEKMSLSYTAKRTRPVSYNELMRFVEAADAMGEGSIGTPAMIAFFWLQRQHDILARLTWSHYRPADAPDRVKIFHHKTGELVDIPLYDEDGTVLWPDIMYRLDAAPRLGTLIVTRDRLDRRHKVHLPWKFDHFRHRVAAIRAVAGIHPDAKFMGFRHGGNVEGAEAGLTDAQLRALSGHRTTAALLRYAQPTEKQRQAGARKRLEARTKRGDLSK